MFPRRDNKGQDSTLMQLALNRRTVKEEERKTDEKELGATNEPANEEESKISYVKSVKAGCTVTRMPGHLK